MLMNNNGGEGDENQLVNNPPSNFLGKRHDVAGDGWWNLQPRPLDRSPPCYCWCCLEVRGGGKVYSFLWKWCNISSFRQMLYYRDGAVFCFVFVFLIHFLFLILHFSQVYRRLHQPKRVLHAHVLPQWFPFPCGCQQNSATHYGTGLVQGAQGRGGW